MSPFSLVQMVLFLLVSPYQVVSVWLRRDGRRRRRRRRHRRKHRRRKRRGSNRRTVEIKGRNSDEKIRK